MGAVSDQRGFIRCVFFIHFFSVFRLFIRGCDCSRGSIKEIIVFFIHFQSIASWQRFEFALGRGSIKSE